MSITASESSNNLTKLTPRTSLRMCDRGDLPHVSKKASSTLGNLVETKEDKYITDDSVVAKYSLSDEQLEALNEIRKGNSIVIDSVIGAGKTTVLQAICDSFPNMNILYLTYNKLLKIDAQKKIKNSNVTVQNYHGFVYRYLITSGLNIEPSKQIRTFLERFSNIKFNFDLICIDEYQDLEEDTVDLLLFIAKKCPNAQWIFVGDMAQKIYDKTDVDVYKDCINKIIPNYVPVSFTKSFRISEKHAEFLSTIWGKTIIGVNSNCEVKTTNSFKDVLNLLDKTPNEQLLVLGPRYGLTQELVNLLEKHNPKKYNKQTVWTSIRDRDENFKIKPNSMIVTTYDGCKGMERPVCVVIDWTNTYFKNRVEKPFVDQSIIRNLFCVAASRGKSEILFYLNDKWQSKKDTNEDTHLLEYEDMSDDFVQVMPTYEPSSMFEFKHTADLMKCIDDIKIEKIEQDDTSTIIVQRADGNIDLTPAVGIYQEITFFHHWNFDRHLNALADKPILNKIKKWIDEQKTLTDEKKALALTAYSTELYRYCNQATHKFITDDQHKKLLERLSSKIDADSTDIQVGCCFQGKFSAKGLIDYVDSDNIPWELKFVSNLTNEHILQAAMYSVMWNSPYAYLWNTMTNDLRKITVVNKDKFIRDVYKCITMGRTLRNE